MAKEIELDYTKDPNLFDTTAKEWAEAIDKTKKTQARNFYEKVLELEAKSKSEEWQDVLPFVKMLNSKVAYASTRNSGGRKLINEAFVSMMTQCISQVNTKEDLKVFKLFFEAVLGFFKGSN